MTALRRAAEVSQLVIKWGGIAIVALMVGRLIIGGLIDWYKTTHPNIPEPTIGFGILPPIEFPEQETKQLVYTLETKTGGLPTFQTQADVLLMEASRPNLLALERSQADAESLGFKVEPEKISDTTYRWRLTSPTPMTLTTSIYDGRFIWKTDWASNPNFLTVKSLPSESQAIRDAREIVNKVTDQMTDITGGEAEVTYLKGTGGSFSAASALVDADFVQVDLFRAAYGEQFEFVTPQTGHGIVRVIISGNTKAGKIIQAIYNYFPINYTAVETYPLKPVSQAWEELLQGSGYIASIDSTATEVVVRSVTLGYFDSFEPQSYMQPVYVFSGDDGFVAYIQAVKDPKVSTSTE